MTIDGTSRALYLVKNALPKDFSGHLTATSEDNPGYIVLYWRR